MLPLITPSCHVDKWGCSPVGCNMIAARNMKLAAAVQAGYCQQAGNESLSVTTCPWHFRKLNKNES